MAINHLMVAGPVFIDTQEQKDGGLVLKFKIPNSGCMPLMG